MIPVVHQRGSVAALHDLDPLGRADVTPEVWWCDADDDAIVLGSRQSDAVVDADACARAGLSIVRRRSGGGAVIMRRRAVHWVDVVLPPGIAPDDIRGSMEWLGELWADVLAPEAQEPLRVHRGGLEVTPWSELICFAGVGPGEVLTGAGKLVGLSQRRTRRGIRVQGLVYVQSVADEYRAVLREPMPDGAPPAEATTSLLDAEAIAGRLASRITTM